jgi:two-component system, NarL family, invasion response regulator UvrY
MITVLLVDDHTIVRHGLRRLLSDCPDMKVIGEATGGKEAMRLIRQFQPDVMVMDLSMPDMDGLDVTKNLQSAGTKTKALILTMHATEEYAMRLMQAGARGFLSKDAPSDEVVVAIRAIAAGGSYLPPAFAQDLSLRYVRHEAPQSPLHSLTDRELQVLKRLAEGARCRDIAKELHLSVKTIDTYRAKVLEKLDLETTADLVRFALRHGVTSENF